MFLNKTYLLNNFLKHKVFSLFIGAFSILVNLSACSDNSNLIRISEKPPDEFAVIRKEPLVIPPNFNLRPPGQSKKPTSDNASDKAKNVLTDSTAGKKRNGLPAPEKLSAGDVILLKKTGYNEKKSGIREVLVTENSQILQNKGRVEILVERLVGDRNDKEVLDPVLEVKRSQEIMATGENLVKSQQPVIIRRISK